MKKLGMLLALGILFINLVSAYNYYGGFFSPESIFQNEWVVFAMIFLIVFGLCYLALLTFFAKGKKIKEIEPEQKKIIGVIAFAVGMLSAVGFIQRNWLETVFGDALGMWILIIILIAVIILTTPFYRALKADVGKTPATLLFILILWGVLKFFSGPYYLDLPYELYNLVMELSSYTALIVALIIGFLISLIGKKKTH